MFTIFSRFFLLAIILTLVACGSDEEKSSATPDSPDNSINNLIVAEDRDGDSVPNSQDAFPDDPNESIDSDGDGIGNNTDTDDDGDTVLDVNDAFPLDNSESVDTDSDGIGNNTDNDDDGDTVVDSDDAFPLDANESLDTDGDAVGNNADTDDDNDGINDGQDTCPLLSSAIDFDNDCIANSVDSDDDNDGVNDGSDVFPFDPNEWADSDGDGIGDNADTNNNNGSGNSNGGALRTDIRMFIFGHSLINYTDNSIPTPSNETAVPHWMYLLAQNAGYNYEASGQYGFLSTHRLLQPVSQWFFDLVPNVWNHDTTAFSQAGFNTTLITPANFIQFQSAVSPYPGNNPDSVSPVSATVEIVDWVRIQSSDIEVFIYENWPDMGLFPPNAQQLGQYHDLANGEFHDWFLDYHDNLRAARPNANIKMIPVGPTISKLLTQTALSTIPVTELYEDSAPHGRATIYFIAGLITYMGMYGVEAPENFQVPSIVHQTVRDNYSVVVDFIWNELQNFNDSDGNSRVF